VTAGPRVVVHPGKQALADAAAARFVTALVDAQTRNPEAQVALTGGSMGSAIIASLTTVPGRSAVDWSRVRVWWGDERYLPAGDADRNDTQNDEAGLSALGLDPAKVHRVAGPEASADAEASATAYAQTIREHGQKAWDVALFGVGPDGHIASLFPDRPEVTVTDAAVLPVRDSPKPPPERVTLTRPVLNSSKRVWLVITGADKASALGLALAGASYTSVPAAGAKGRKRTVFFVDEAAAAEVSPDLIDPAY
jgi:6-phosphogluconolactonase